MLAEIFAHLDADRFSRRDGIRKRQERHYCRHRSEQRYFSRNRLFPAAK